MVPPNGTEDEDHGDLDYVNPSFFFFFFFFMLKKSFIFFFMRNLLYFYFLKEIINFIL